MDKAAFLAEARALVRDRSKLVVLPHARTRDPKQGKLPLSDIAIQTCVENGHVVEGPSPDLKEANGWKGTISRYVPEQRASVACVIVPGQRMIVITAFEQITFTRKPPHPAGSPDTGDDEPDEERGNDDQV